MDKIIIACPLPNDRAKNGIRTRDLNLGKVALYQLSYFRELKCKERLNANLKIDFIICKKIVLKTGLEPVRALLLTGF